MNKGASPDGDRATHERSRVSLPSAWQSPETAPSGEYIYLRDRDGRNLAFGYFDDQRRWHGPSLPNAFEWKRA